MRKRPERIVGDVARRLGLLGLIATVLVALLGVLAPAASASPTFHPQTRVAAIEQPTGQVVGPHDSVLADQGRPRAPNYDRTATGSSVAAEGEAGANGVDLSLQYKEGWTAEQIAAADTKVGALNAAAENGDLSVTQVERGGTSAASMFRSAGGEIPPGADVDHIIDLQLGGANEISNLSPLDYSVNRSLGAQIACQIRGLPVGTPIASVSIC